MYSQKPVTLRAGEFHLSPNELALAARLEAQRRRLLRLSQVRQQARDWSARVRRRCRQAEISEARRIVSAERAEQAADRLAEADELAAAYSAALASLGQSHRAAEALPDPVAEAAVEQAANQAAAEQRHAVALDVLRESRASADQRKRQAANQREAALVVERERSARIAALPPPPPPPYALPVEPPPLVAKCDGDAMDTRFYGAPPDGYEVSKATLSDKENSAPAETAADAALAETAKRQAETEAAERQAAVNTERAAVRGQTALRREFVQQAYQQMLTDLAGLHRAELHNRQLQFGQLPRDNQQGPQQHRGLYNNAIGRSHAERVFEQRFLIETDAVVSEMQLRDHLEQADDNEDVEMKPRPGIPMPTEQSPQKPTPERDNDDELPQDEDQERQAKKPEHLKPLLERINQQKQRRQNVEAEPSGADTRLDLSRLVEAGQIRSQVHERLRALERDITERERFLGEPTGDESATNPDSGFSTARTGAAGPLFSDRQRQQQQQPVSSRLEPLNEEQAELQRLENEYAMLEERLARLHDGEAAEGDGAFTGEMDAADGAGGGGNDSGAEDLTYRDCSVNKNDDNEDRQVDRASLPAASSAPFLASRTAASTGCQRRESIASSAASTLTERVREFQRRALQRLGSTQTVSSGGGAAPSAPQVAAPAASVAVQTARRSSSSRSCSCSSCADYDESVEESDKSSSTVSCRRDAKQQPSGRRSHRSRPERLVVDRNSINRQSSAASASASTTRKSAPSATVAEKLRIAKRQLEIEREKEDLMQQFLRLRLLQEQRAQLDNLVASLGNTTAAAAAAAAAAATVASTGNVQQQQPPPPPLPSAPPPLAMFAAATAAAETEFASCSCDAASSTSIETDYEYEENETLPVASAHRDQSASTAFDSIRETVHQPVAMETSVYNESSQIPTQLSPATRDVTAAPEEPPMPADADSIATIEALPVEDRTALSSSFAAQPTEAAAAAASFSDSAANSSGTAPSYLPEFLPIAASRQQQQQQQQASESTRDSAAMTDFFLTFDAGHRPPPPAVAIRHPQLAVEQQHELSTIAEVDTPTATTITAAAYSSTIRLQQQQQRNQQAANDMIAEAFGDGRGELTEFDDNGVDYDDNDSDDADSCSPCPGGIEIAGGCASQLAVQAQKIRLLREYFSANAHRLAELKVSDSNSNLSRSSSSGIEASGISQRPLSTAVEDTASGDIVETDEPDDDEEESTISAIDVVDGNTDAAASVEASPTHTLPLVATAITAGGTKTSAATNGAESTLGVGVVSQAPLPDSSASSFDLTTRPITAAPSEVGMVSQVPITDSDTLPAVAAATVLSKSGSGLSQQPLSGSLTTLTQNSHTLVASDFVQCQLRPSKSTGELNTAAELITQLPLADTTLASTVKPGGSSCDAFAGAVALASQHPLADSSTATATGIGHSTGGLSQQPLSSSSSTSAASSVITVAQSSSGVTLPLAVKNATTSDSSSLSQHPVRHEQDISSGSPSASLASFRRHELEVMSANGDSPSATLPALPAPVPPPVVDPLLSTATNLATIRSATEAVRKRAEERRRNHQANPAELPSSSSSSDIQRDIERLQTALESWKTSRIGVSDSSSANRSVATAAAVAKAPALEVVTKDSEQRKAQELNAVERSRRLYQNLEEVQRRRIADERRLERRENIEKAKEFNRRMREQSKRKQQLLKQQQQQQQQKQHEKDN